MVCHGMTWYDIYQHFSNYEGYTPFLETTPFLYWAIFSGEFMHSPRGNYLH